MDEHEGADDRAERQDEVLHPEQALSLLHGPELRDGRGEAGEGRRHAEGENDKPALVSHQSLTPNGGLVGSSPIIFPGSPEGWWGDEALQAEAQAPQAARDQRHQAAGNIPALRSRGLFAAGVRSSPPSHRPVDPAQGRPSDSTSTSRSSRS